MFQQCSLFSSCLTLEKSVTCLIRDSKCELERKVLTREFRDHRALTCHGASACSRGLWRGQAGWGWRSLLLSGPLPASARGHGYSRTRRHSWGQSNHIKGRCFCFVFSRQSRTLQSTFSSTNVMDADTQRWGSINYSSILSIELKHWGTKSSVPSTQ